MVLNLVAMTHTIFSFLLPLGKLAWANCPSFVCAGFVRNNSCVSPGCHCCCQSGGPTHTVADLLAQTAEFSTYWSLVQKIPGYASLLTTDTVTVLVIPNSAFAAIEVEVHQAFYLYSPRC